MLTKWPSTTLHLWKVPNFVEWNTKFSNKSSTFVTYRSIQFQKIAESPKGLPQSADAIWGLNTNLYFEELTHTHINSGQITARVPLETC